MIIKFVVYFFGGLGINMHVIEISKAPGFWNWRIDFQRCVKNSLLSVDAVLSAQADIGLFVRSNIGNFIVDWVPLKKRLFFRKLQSDLCVSCGFTNLIYNHSMSLSGGR